MGLVSVDSETPPRPHLDPVAIKKLRRVRCGCPSVQILHHETWNSREPTVGPHRDPLSPTKGEAPAGRTPKPVRDPPLPTPPTLARSLDHETERDPGRGSDAQRPRGGADVVHDGGAEEANRDVWRSPRVAGGATGGAGVSEVPLRAPSP